MTKDPIKAFEKISIKYEEIRELTKVINKALEDKYEDIYLEYNHADGLVLLFDEGSNMLVSRGEIVALLSPQVTEKEALEYLRENKI